jgi:putative DNA primase/helicase
MHDARSITAALRGRWQGSHGLCRCPAHDDRTPSLKVKDDPRKSDGIDVHCFAGCPWQDVKAELIRRQLLPELKSSPSIISAVPITVSVPDDTADRVHLALRIWNAAGPLRDSLGFRYFTERRQLHVGLLDLDHVLRFHEGFNAVVALMTDAVTGEPCGVHRTILGEDGTKIDKKMLGRQGVIRMSLDEEVTMGLGICEGIEDGLGILLSGWAPVWVAANAGGIARLPVLSGIEALTIFHDDDSAGNDAAETCARRWHDAGREVFLASVKEHLK